VEIEEGEKAGNAGPRLKIITFASFFTFSHFDYDICLPFPTFAVLNFVHHGQSMSGNR